MEKSLEELMENPEMEQPAVSFLVHEADMAQKDADNERMHETHKQVTRDMHKAYLFIIVFLVISFTIRMWIWNSTITKMNDSMIQIAMLHHTEAYNAEEASTP